MAIYLKRVIICPAPLPPDGGRAAVGRCPGVPAEGLNLRRGATAGVVPDPSDDPDPERVKTSLRRLAGADERAVIDRAEAAVDDLETAAEFVDSMGVAELAAAVETVDDPALADRGERALSSFRRFRAAAAGRLDDDHFHPGRGTDLRRDDEPSSR